MIFLGLAGMSSAAFAAKTFHPAIIIQRDTIPQKDTVPKIDKNRKGISKYIHIITDRQQRDSVLARMSRQSITQSVSDSLLWRQRQDNFVPFGGKFIRNIYYNQLKVFGTQIEDTAVAKGNLISFANKLHYNTRTWMIRQSLFFREGDTVNAYKMVDNERYLRSLPFLQDARLYIINTYQNSDSIDIVVVTKDLFEYGGSIANLSNTSAAATVYNTNLLGAGQRAFFGFKWNEPYRPQWRTGIGYSKYNLGGSFTDVSVGYSVLNDHTTIDSGVYEKSYYLSINRPLYSSWAKFTGGFNLAFNSSVNIFSLPDSIYRNYEYSIVDIWGGYNFRNQFKGNGINTKKPNIAVELRDYTLDFSVRPEQDKLQYDPYYNNHNYLLSKLVFFNQEFFKTNYFFGFGKTEDIPLGYNFSGSYGIDDWVGRKRTYTAVEGQKYWLPGKNLISTAIGLSTFWYNRQREDAVFHVQADYYSNLFWLKDPKLREFLHADYIICINPVLYKPININKENGLIGYRYTLINGYQRLNMSAQTNFYSRLNVYGFKFNFYALAQGSLLADDHQSIATSRLYTGFTLGCQIRNENLPLNTLQLSISYQPSYVTGAKTVFIQIGSTIPFGFNIFALQAPAEIQFK
jgi:hypothetical protein